MSADDLIQIGSRDRLIRRMVVTSIADRGFLLGQSRDGHDDPWLNATKVLVQWSLVASLNSVNFGQTTLGEVCVCALGKVMHIWTKWKD